jgi:hypothetical protein
MSETNIRPGDDLAEETRYILDGAWIHDGMAQGEATKEAVLRALVRLPEDVREFALMKCVFVPSGISSHYVPLEQLVGYMKRQKKEWLVFLIGVGLHGYTDEDVESVAAHEIAHLWLGHPTFADADSKCEVEAAELVKSWGFKGPGTNPTWTPGTLRH